MAISFSMGQSLPNCHMQTAESAMQSNKVNGHICHKVRISQSKSTWWKMAHIMLESTDQWGSVTVSFQQWWKRELWKIMAGKAFEKRMIWISKVNLLR